MHKLEHYLPYALGLILVGCALFITWKLARRWNAEIKSAREYRAHLEGEAAAAAQMRAALSQTVNANPTINIGSRVFTQLRDTRRDSSTPTGDRTLCPVCARSDCWFDCTTEITDGPANDILARTVAERSVTRLDQIVARTLRSNPRTSTPDLGESLDYQEALEEGDPGP